MLSPDVAGLTAENKPRRCEYDDSGTPLNSILLLPPLAPRTNRPKVPSTPCDTPGILVMCRITSGSPIAVMLLAALIGLKTKTFPRFCPECPATTTALSSWVGAEFWAVARVQTSRSGTRIQLRQFFIISLLSILENRGSRIYLIREDPGSQCKCRSGNCTGAHNHCMPQKCQGRFRYCRKPPFRRTRK